MPHSPIHTLKAHFPQCFDKNGDLMPHKLQEAVLDLAQENQANLAQQSTTKQKDNTKDKEQNDTAQDLQEQDSREKDAILSLSKETYTLNWLGKSYAKLLRHLPTDTLIAQDLAHNAQAEHKNSKNVLIKGDNLEVLKHLKNAYYNKIKMIYIDPPYNTGKDGFIYNDERDFTPQSLAQMANIEVDEASKILNYTLKNSSTHSAWLSFMYPRLYIARQLLRDDGVIFISIDDNEQANLKILCDEIFGEENFVACIFTLDNLKGKSNENFISSVGHKILVYTKHFDTLNNMGGLNEVENIFGDKIDNKFKNEDNLGFYTLNSFCKTGQGRYREDRPTMYYPILIKDEQIKMIEQDEFEKIYNKHNKQFDDNFVDMIKQKYENLGFSVILPTNQKREKLRWTSSYMGAKNLIENNDLIFNQNSIMQKKRPDLKEMLQFYASGIPKNFMYKPQYANGTDDLKIIFDKEVFSYPKSIELIKDLLKISTTPNNPAFTGGGGGDQPSADSARELDSHKDFSDTHSTPCHTERSEVSQDSRDFSLVAQNDKNGYFADAQYDNAQENHRDISFATQTQYDNEQDIILDFFAGSGTTAHAVMELNAQDNGNRQFILVQLDEKIDSAKSKVAYDFCKNELGSENPTIFDITKERIKRASAKIAQSQSQTHPLAPSARKGEQEYTKSTQERKSLDLGFKIYEIRHNDLQSNNDSLFDSINLSDDDKNALLESFKLQDSLPLTLQNHKVDLGGYEGILAGEKLYLLNPNFTTKHLQHLIEKIDTQKDFVIKEISYLNNVFDSAKIREIEEGIASYANKKGLKILVRARFI